MILHASTTGLNTLLRGLNILIPESYEVEKSCESITFWLSRIAAHEEHGFPGFVLHFLCWWM
jgi:hypothetical protein